MLISCRIIDHCIKKRLQWNTSFVRKVCKESEYYDDMMRYLRRNLAVCVVAKVLILFIDPVPPLMIAKVLLQYKFLLINCCLVRYNYGNFCSQRWLQCFELDNMF